MKLLSGILAATLTSVVALASANAADMYAGGGYKDGPAYVGVNWSGLYVGVNGGYGWSQNTYPVDPPALLVAARSAITSNAAISCSA